MKRIGLKASLNDSDIQTQTDSESEELEWLAAFRTVLYLQLLFSLVLPNSSEGLKNLTRKERHG